MVGVLENTLNFKFAINYNAITVAVPRIFLKVFLKKYKLYNLICLSFIMYWLIKLLIIVI